MEEEWNHTDTFVLTLALSQFITAMIVGGVTIGQPLVIWVLITAGLGFVYWFLRIAYISGKRKR
jgi:hypothetical protein